MRVNVRYKTTQYSGETVTWVHDTYYAIALAEGAIFHHAAFLEPAPTVYPRIYHPYTAMSNGLSNPILRLSAKFASKLAPKSNYLKVFDREAYERATGNLKNGQLMLIDAGSSKLFPEMYGALASTYGPLLSYYILWIQNVLKST